MIESTVTGAGCEGNPDARGGCVSGNEWCDEQESI